MFLHVEGFQVEVKPALLPWEAATVYEFRLGEKIGLKLHKRENFLGSDIEICTFS